jgi:hydroxypyruvate reductase
MTVHMKPGIFVAATLPPELQSLRDGPYTLHLGEGKPPDLSLPQLEGVRAIITNGIRGASRELIDTFPQLEIIACLGVGVDAIDLAHAHQRGVRVINTPGVIANDVADLAMMMILERLRRGRDSNAFLLRGDWLAGAFPLTRTVNGRRLGIVGLGSIGQAIAARAAAFGMQVCWHGPRPKLQVPLPYFADLIEMARSVDVLALSCAGGPATRHLVDARVLEALGPEGVLVNVARGSVVDTAALVQALEQGTLGSAALDVFEDEPRVPDALRRSDRVLLTPHLGSATRETRIAMGAMAMTGLAEHFAGREPANLVALP